MLARDQLLAAAERLHAHLLGRHYDRGLLHGPDAGVRFNLRLWRFLKSALDFVPWRDDYVFMQTQGYWILANWMLHEATGEPRYREVAQASTEATPWSRSRGAPAPPMSVLTHPGETAFTARRGHSWARRRVKAFRAALLSP